MENSVRETLAFVSVTIVLLLFTTVAVCETCFPTPTVPKSKAAGITCTADWVLVWPLTMPVHPLVHSETVRTALHKISAPTKFDVATVSRPSSLEPLQYLTISPPNLI
jgi:hypothetical protein